MIMLKESLCVYMYVLYIYTPTFSHQANLDRTSIPFIPCEKYVKKCLRALVKHKQYNPQGHSSVSYIQLMRFQFNPFVADNMFKQYYFHLISQKLNYTTAEFIALCLAEWSVNNLH